MPFSLSASELQSRRQPGHSAQDAIAGALHPASFIILRRSSASLSSTAAGFLFSAKAPMKASIPDQSIVQLEVGAARTVSKSVEFCNQKSAVAHCAVFLLTHVARRNFVNLEWVWGDAMQQQ